MILFVACMSGVLLSPMRDQFDRCSDKADASGDSDNR